MRGYAGCLTIRPKVLMKNFKPLLYEYLVNSLSQNTWRISAVLKSINLIFCAWTIRQIYNINLTRQKRDKYTEKSCYCFIQKLFIFKSISLLKDVVHEVNFHQVLLHYGNSTIPMITKRYFSPNRMDTIDILASQYH